ncbi:MAG: helix-turn-helix domain-containing protein [Thermoplasmata archaeon]|nr:helix-turn-helix domain-containing protein [Thermoplasmata archaeon]
MTLSLPTAPLVKLGLFPGRFFEHNASLEVLQAFRLAREDITLLTRITRREAGPSTEEVGTRAAELREKYGLGHFELLEVSEGGTGYTALLRVSLTEGMGEVLGLLPSDILPARPFVIEAERTRVSFHATDAQVAGIRGILDGLGLAYAVERSRRVAGTDLQPLGDLTERQRHLLELAHELGYYKSPARTDLARIAEIAGVSKAAVSKQLRAAEGKVFDELFGPAASGD